MHSHKISTTSTSVIGTFLICLLLGNSINTCNSFTPLNPSIYSSPALVSNKLTTATTTTVFTNSISSDSSQETTQLESTSSIEELPTSDWELDCYSRPVLVDGKKLWEILITDSSGVLKVCETLPSNRVNSRELRRVIEETIENSEVKPSTIRFFRGAMFNMINIALSEVDVIARPSRCTFALATWLEERNREVYPKMEGYKSSMVSSDAFGNAFLDVRTPVKLPDALRGEKYAFVSLPLAEFLPGGDINRDNIGVGRLCPISSDLPADAFVQGIVILTSRAKALASWLSGTEVAGFKADLRRRTLAMEADISTQYLVAKLNDVQRAEAVAFEEGKDMLNGLHFVSVQKDEDDDPAGFWLLREIPPGL
eukprot:CAMPEP_0178962492 /NCGR_PEP_ID=MMETSP0789-20121207/14397_1 /TAXON_ID=3005 /ORGANISM="Rhizosolenia setigera, Strain CCMP 1694" /LENGTH=367 /DNA_ID=CAMNT_0020646653 /DNA_START=226 /DNA_END=1329 /DNA_ORIENTATION=+